MIFAFIIGEISFCGVDLGFNGFLRSPICIAAIGYHCYDENSNYNGSDGPEWKLRWGWRIIIVAGVGIEGWVLGIRTIPIIVAAPFWAIINIAIRAHDLILLIMNPNSTGIISLFDHGYEFWGKGGDNRYLVAGKDSQLLLKLRGNLRGKHLHWGRMMILSVDDCISFGY